MKHKQNIKAGNLIVAFLASAFQAFGMYNIHAVSDITEGGVLGATLLLERAQSAGLTQQVEMVSQLTAPVAAGQELGKLTVTSPSGEPLALIPIVAGESIPRLTFAQVLQRLLRTALLAG